MGQKLRCGSVKPSPAVLVRTAFNLSNLLVQNENSPHPMDGDCFHGGLEEIRTPDPRNANAMRSQLRYKPVVKIICIRFFLVKRYLSWYYL